MAKILVKRGTAAQLATAAGANALLQGEPYLVTDESKLAVGLSVSSFLRAVMEGDARLSDAREWTADVVTQGEAEAGVATTARKWTAERVAQAIAALAPAPGSATWGAIGGTLSNQTDLQAALDATVKLTGDQTVAGEKDFTSRLHVAGATDSGVWIGQGVRTANRSELHLHSNGENVPTDLFFGHGERIDANTRWSISDRGVSDAKLSFYRMPALGSTSELMSLAANGDLSFTGSLTGGTVPWARLSGVPSLVSTQYNSSLNSDSRNSRGVTRLYRSDSNTDYSVQTNWTGTRWLLRGYNGDTFHAECEVAHADNATTLSGLSIHTGTNNEANKVVRTNASGYALFGWINTTSGAASNAQPARIYCSQDSYLRYMTAANFRTYMKTPQIFVQSGTPSGHVTGDLWVW